MEPSINGNYVCLIRECLKYGHQFVIISNKFKKSRMYWTWQKYINILKITFWYLGKNGHISLLAHTYPNKSWLYDRFDKKKVNLVWKYYSSTISWNKYVKLCSISSPTEWQLSVNHN